MEYVCTLISYTSVIHEIERINKLNVATQLMFMCVRYAVHTIVG